MSDGIWQGTIQASKKKDKKSKNKRVDLDEDGPNDAQSPAPVLLDTSVNPDDEWPEEDVKRKKGKRGKKEKKMDEEQDEMEVDAESIPMPTPVLEASSAPAVTLVNVDDDWPEEGMKPKKGKKGRGGKKTVDEHEDDWMNGTTELKKDEVEEKKAPIPEPVENGEVTAVDSEADGEPGDDGPKVKRRRMRFIFNT